MNESTQAAPLPLSFDAYYRAVSGRDARLDGRVYLGVTSTGIYCRPSCPAQTPKRENCRFFPTSAACVAAGFRACKRCAPEAAPGTREWDTRSDLAARAVRRIRDGAVDALGVSGLATELAVSERHLRRLLVEEVGASPAQLARTRRAHAARALIDQTHLPLTDIAFAAGFGSVRQFGEVMREEFGAPPSQLPRRGGSTVAHRENSTDRPPRASDQPPTLALQLRTRAPFDAGALRSGLVAHAIPGRDFIGAVDPTSGGDPSGDRSGDRSSDPRISAVAPTFHAIDVPGGTAVLRIDWAGVDPEASAPDVTGTVSLPVQLTLPSLADTMPAITATRRLLDLDADPSHIAEALRHSELLAPLVLARPGLRLQAARQAAEFALGTILGQQVSLAAARTLQGRLAEQFATSRIGFTAAGIPGGSEQQPDSSAPMQFFGAPDISRIAATPAEEIRAALGLTRTRAATIQAIASALDSGLDLSPGADRERARHELGAIRGIGPWTVEIIAMRALGDPDAFPAGDLILQRQMGEVSEREARTMAEAWRPFRGYAAGHLWARFLDATPPPKKDAR